MCAAPSIPSCCSRLECPLKGGSCSCLPVLNPTQNGQAALLSYVFWTTLKVREAFPVVQTRSLPICCRHSALRTLTPALRPVALLCHTWSPTSKRRSQNLTSSLTTGGDKGCSVLTFLWRQRLGVDQMRHSILSAGCPHASSFGT